MKLYLATQRTRYLRLALLLVSAACQGSGGDDPSHGTGGTPANAVGAAGSAAGPTAGGGAAGAGDQGGAAGSVNTAGTTHQAGSSGSMSSSGSAGATGGTAAAGAGSAGAAGAAGAAGGPFPAGVIKPRIMIVGDSISAGPGCYKKYLLKNLTDNGYRKLEFVGEYTDDCDGGGVRHSAVSCSNAEQYTHDTFMMPNCQQGKSFPGMAPLVTNHEPDLIMLQLGVNDVWGGTPTATTLERYKTLIEQARAKNPRIVTVVAQIQKIRPDCGSDDSVQKRAEELVKAVPAWAQQLSTAPSPVFVADLWTNSDWSKAETLDCVHPNDVGAQKMGMNWFNALKDILTPG
jgi:hypothetical protein